MMWEFSDIDISRESLAMRGYSERCNQEIACHGEITHKKGQLGERKEDLHVNTSAICCHTNVRSTNQH
jgi:hypothetical protein